MNDYSAILSRRHIKESILLETWQPFIGKNANIIYTDLYSLSNEFYIKNLWSGVKYNICIL